MKTRSRSQSNSYEMEFDTIEEEEQYENFMAKHSPKKFREYMQQKKARPTPPNFDDSDFESAGEEPVAATPFPTTNEQPAEQPACKIDDYKSSLGDNTSQTNPQIMIQMMNTMKTNCDAMEQAMATKDAQITQLVAALAAQKEASKKQADEFQELRLQMAQLTAAPAPRFDTDSDSIPNTNHNARSQDTDPDTQPQGAFKNDSERSVSPEAGDVSDKWEPVALSTGDTTNQFDELVASFVLHPTITMDRKDVFDIPSLADYILKKRPDVKMIFKHDNDTGHVLVEQARAAAAKINATVRSLSSAGKLLTVMQILAILGDDDRRGDVQLAVENALQHDATDLQALICDVRSGTPLMYSQTNKPIAQMKGMHAIILDAKAGKCAFIELIYDLLMAMLAAQSKAAHNDAMAALRSIQGSLPRHQIRYEQKWYDTAMKTLGPDAPAFWTVEQRMHNLINTRTESTFADEFFEDLCTNDLDWKRMSWREVVAHYEKIALRMSLRTPDSKPTRALELQSPAHSRRSTRPQKEDTDAGETYCCYHGKNKGHETLECSLFTHWDAEICEQYSKRRLCFFDAAGRCTKGEACRNKHAEPELIEELGNPILILDQGRTSLLVEMTNRLQ